jgi:hypothetical protein
MKVSLKFDSWHSCWFVIFCVRTLSSYMNLVCIFFVLEKIDIWLLLHKLLVILYKSSCVFIPGVVSFAYVQMFQSWGMDHGTFFIPLSGWVLYVVILVVTKGGSFQVLCCLDTRDGYNVLWGNSRILTLLYWLGISCAPLLIYYSSFAATKKKSLYNFKVYCCKL